MCSKISTAVLATLRDVCENNNSSKCSYLENKVRYLKFVKTCSNIYASRGQNLMFEWYHLSLTYADAFFRRGTYFCLYCYRSHIAFPSEVYLHREAVFCMKKGHPECSCVGGVEALVAIATEVCFPCLRGINHGRVSPTRYLHI